MVEIARSFSYRKNLGNYEHLDFFCSQKAECAIEDAEKVSEALYAFCKSEVIKAVNLSRKESLPKVQRETPTAPKYWWGSEEPPAWANKSDKSLKAWLFRNGYTSSFNDAGAFDMEDSNSPVAGVKEE